MELPCMAAHRRQLETSAQHQPTRRDATRPAQRPGKLGQVSTAEPHV
jgi:hypothetical protein